MVDVRVLEGDDDEVDALWVTFTALMLGVPSAEAVGRALSSTDGGRSWGAFEQGSMIGRVRCFDVETTVPGGAQVATAAVSAVGVLPTHTRRGVLSALKAAQLEAERARGQVLASLRASEAPIYGRYGYGLAGLFADHRVERGAALRPEARALADPAGRLRLLRRGELLDVVPALYDEVGRRHVGAISRTDAWWQRNLGPITKDTSESGRWVAVLHDGSEQGLGYVDYEVKEAKEWDEFVRRPIEVHDLFAVDTGAYVTLWRHLLDLDLAGSLVARHRPVEEPLRWLLHDTRALRTTRVADEQWVRLLDVRAALAARTYRDIDTSVVLSVEDAMFPANGAVFRLSPAGAQETTDRPDLSMDIAAMSALYLGGTSASSLVAAGRIACAAPGAAGRADVLLSVDPAPWCGSFF